MRKAFTLIELLIVVAIIAILAAIAVPNFLEAQTRSKVSRAKADLRTLVTGLESYCVDNNSYPMCNNEMLDGWRPQSDASNDNRYLERLSTPVAYLTSPLMKDPFTPTRRYSDFSSGNHQGTLVDQTGDGDLPRILEFKYGSIKMGAGPSAGYANTGPEKPVAYQVYCAGPDRGFVAPGSLMPLQDYPAVSAQFYDPTNGTVSYGDIWRVGGSAFPGAGNWGGVFFELAKARSY